MNVPLQVTSRDFPMTDALQGLIEKKAAKLETFFDRIQSCRVVIECPHKNKTKGNVFHVRIDMTVPGKEFVIKRKPNSDVYAAIRDAFGAAQRLIEDHSQKVRNQVKTKDMQPEGVIKTLYPPEDYGFLLSPEGRDVFFHRNAVLNGDFDKLQVGSRVRFVQEQGDKGLQASTVSLLTE